MTSTVFVSYTTRDDDEIGSKFAQKVFDHIEQQPGLTAFMDKHRVNPGVNWEDAILQSLDTADAGIILVSAAAASSPYVQSEAAFLRTRNRGSNGVFSLVVIEIGPNARSATEALQLEYLQAIPCTNSLDEIEDIVATAMKPFETNTRRFEDDRDHVQLIADLLGLEHVLEQSLIKLARALSVEIREWKNVGSAKKLYAWHVALALVDTPFVQSCELIEAHLNVDDRTQLAWLIAAYKMGLSDAHRFVNAATTDEQRGSLPWGRLYL